MSSTKPTVAIIGLGGTLGQPLIQAFTSETFSGFYSTPIKALSRDPSKYKSTEDVEYLKGDFDDEGSLEKSLEGVDILIDATSLKANKITLADAAKAAGVKLYVLPGVSTNLVTERDAHPWCALPEDKLKELDYVQNSLKTLNVVNGVFSELALTAPQFFHILPDQKLILRGEHSDEKFSCTSIEDVAKSVAAIVHRPLSEIPQIVKLSGDSTSVDNVIENFQKTQTDDYTVQPVPWTETAKQANASAQWVKDQAGKPFDFSSYETLIHMSSIVYANLLFPDSRTHFLFEKNDNEWVNPNNKYFTWKSWNLK